MNLENDYFEWLISMIADEPHLRRKSYRKLLMYLHGVTFRWSNVMDENRAKDGNYLRSIYIYEMKIEDAPDEFFDQPCSVLEMMLALANRMENEIMSNSDVGNRTGKWFWDMLVSLGLCNMYDVRYDRDYVEQCIDRFLNKEYEYDGSGGLFTVPNVPYDLRDVEIWYQMNWYLNDILSKGE